MQGAIGNQNGSDMGNHNEHNHGWDESKSFISRPRSPVHFEALIKTQGDQ